jgi:hypothetical protein
MLPSGLSLMQHGVQYVKFTIVEIRAEGVLLLFTQLCHQLPKLKCLRKVNLKEKKNICIKHIKLKEKKLILIFFHQVSWSKPNEKKLILIFFHQVVWSRPNEKKLILIFFHQLGDHGTNIITFFSLIYYLYHPHFSDFLYFSH